MVPDLLVLGQAIYECSWSKGVILDLSFSCSNGTDYGFHDVFSKEIITFL